MAYPILGGGACSRQMFGILHLLFLGQYQGTKEALLQPNCKHKIATYIQPYAPSPPHTHMLTACSN